MRSAPRKQEIWHRIEWDVVATWGFCFGLVVLLGLEGGGYDALVHDQVGIALWWILGLGLLVGALPRATPSRTALAALCLFAAFVAWIALSMIWTESAERSLADLARAAVYLGAFALILSLRSPREPGRLVAALAAAIVFITLLALLSRLHPAWFPSADQTARFLADSRERLSFPLNYWNGLAALIAIGAPLVLNMAATARTLAVRAVSAAVLPAMGLALFFTLSRGGIAAALGALLVYLIFAGDRVPKLLAALFTGAGAVLLIALGAQRDAIRHGLATDLAHDQGNELILFCLLVGLVVGVVHATVSYYLSAGRRPAWTVPGRNQSVATLLGLAAVILVVAAAVDAPGRIGDAVDEFRGGGGAGSGTGRLNSFAGESRYDLWVSAVDQNATAPLIGTGSGTFVYWWTRDAAGEEAVQDAHSFYLQTLGEVGIVGLLLVLAFLGVVLGFGAKRAVRLPEPGGSVMAAALAGCVAFCLGAAVDWSWQMPVLVVAMLILAAALVGGGEPFERGGALLRRLPVRIGAALLALVVILVTAVPLASTSLIRDSEAAVREGDLEAALADARSAENVEPGAATPRLQQALVLELQGNLPAASEAAREATDRESTNWRTWLVLSRIEAERGNADAALAAYRKAKSLNPLSPLFDR